MSTKPGERRSSAETVPMYDDFSTDYDRFIDWESRLTAEIPFLVRQLREAEANRVLDAACGTGMHALALAELGYEVVGTDLSSGMIERARSNRDRAALDVRFAVAGFGRLASTVIQVGGEKRFDAMLCLGNSLPHVLTAEQLAIALDDFAACLRPRGLLLIQNRNFDAVLIKGDRWMSPQTHQEPNSEWLFLRFYDFDPDGLLTFNMVRLQRERTKDWAQQVASTRLWPQTHEELTQALERARFNATTSYGNLEGDPFVAVTSPNLVLKARRSSD